MKKFYTGIIIFSVFIILCVVYKKKENKEKEKQNDTFLIKKYLLNTEQDFQFNSRPILFIHIPYEYNSRNWTSFGSRNSCDLNIPFLYFTLKSIIMYCEKSFHICIINDTSFKKLLPEWKIDITQIPDPIKKQIRNLGIMKLLNAYGGMNVPVSFLCCKDLIQMYETNIGNSSNIFVCETVNTNITSDTMKFYPNIEFMGCSKNNRTMQEFINFMEINISHDFTAENIFVGKINKWMYNKGLQNKIQLVDASYIGQKNKNGNQVILDNLMSDQYLELHNDSYGIFIPLHDMLRRTQYQYYLRMNKVQILESDCILSKHILIANIPISEQEQEEEKEKTYEEMVSKQNVGWWITDLKPFLWGIKPLMVAPKDNVMKRYY